MLKRRLFGQLFWRSWWALLLLLVLGGYWLLPISGQVLIWPGQTPLQNLWPQMVVSPVNPQPGEPVTIMMTDTMPWANVRLTVAGWPATFVDWQAQPTLKRWSWQWTSVMPAQDAISNHEIIFYRDCNTDCQLRGRLSLGWEREQANPIDHIERLD